MVWGTWGNRVPPPELQILSGIPKKEVRDSIGITENTSGFWKVYEKKVAKNCRDSIGILKKSDTGIPKLSYQDSIWITENLFRVASGFYNKKFQDSKNDKWDSKTMKISHFAILSFKKEDDVVSGV